MTGKASRIMTVKMRIISLLLVILAYPCVAQDNVVTIEGTRIRGDQEVPTVLYLVPWQPPEVQSLARADEHLMLQRPIEPLERQEFQRMVSYHQSFRLSTGDEPISGGADSKAE